MNNNYDDYMDFYNYKNNNKNDKYEKFLDELLGPEDENPSVVRNVGCRFTDNVLDYLASEWMVEIVYCSHDVQNKAIDLINELKGKDSVPNVAAKIYKLTKE